MLAKYAKKFGLEDISTSDIEINACIQRKSQADNALIDTRYKIAKVKQQVNYWKFLINILGWIFIVIGYIGVSLNLFGLIFFNPQVFEVCGPRQSCKNFGYPNVPYIINLGLDALSSATTLYLCVCCRKFSGVPTRTDTWSLCKKAIYIALIKSQILIVRYFSSIITIEYTVSQWEENFFKDEGVYILRNRSMGDTYIYSKPKTTTISQEYEKKVKQQAGKFFSSIVLTSFFMSFCCLSIYCVITIISLYKFHDTAKELSIIEEYSAIRNMSVERQENQNVRVSQYRSAPSVDVPRDSITLQNLNP